MAEPELRLQLSVAPERRGRLGLTAEFSVPPGISVLFGASGSGKTTLLSSVAGVFRPDAGRIELGDQTLFDAARGIDLPPEARRVAMVFQSLALFPHLSAQENVAYGLPRSLAAEERRGRACRWLERMHVGHVADRAPRTLSGGEAQRVALARALAIEPRVLLLDEPFSALDERLRQTLSDEVRTLVQELAIPCLLVTHDRSEGQRLSRRVFELEGGRVHAPG